VVAKPRPLLIERDHEPAGLLQLLQDALAIITSCQQIGQRTAHALQHRGPQQQTPDLLRLALEHLGERVLGDRPLAASEIDSDLLE